MFNIRPCKIIAAAAVASFALVAYFGITKKHIVEDDHEDIDDQNKLEIQNETKQEVNIDKKQENSNLPIAQIKIKDKGIMEFELYPNVAPNTVNNFIYLANIGHYDNSEFYRVIKDFLVQVSLDSNRIEYTIDGEFTSNGFRNDLKHKEGVLSMARSIDKNSASDEFFIMTGDDSSLDGNYAAFGKIISGQDILKEINNAETDEINDIPIEKIVIESIIVNTKNRNYPEPEKNN